MADQDSSIPIREPGYNELVLILASKLREVRKQRGMTLKEMALKLGKGAAYLSIMEKPARHATVEGQIRTLLALGISRNELACAITEASSAEARRATG